jgi:hypothetical protein
VAFGGEHLDQVAAPRHHGLQFPLGWRGQRAQRRLHALGEARQQPRVERVGLGQLSGGPGEIAHLARIDHHHRQAGRAQLRHQRGLQAARGLDYHPRERGLAQAREQRRDAALVIGDLEQLARRAQRHIHTRLAHIDAHPDCGFHPTASPRRCRRCPFLRHANSPDDGSGDCAGFDLPLRARRPLLRCGLARPRIPRSAAPRFRSIFIR